MADACVVVDWRGPPGQPGEAVFAWLTGAQVLAHQGRYALDSTAAVFTVQLPALSLGQPGWAIFAVDAGGHAGANPVTFAPAEGDQIDGVTASVELGTSRGALRLVINPAGTSWQTVNA